MSDEKWKFLSTYTSPPFLRQPVRSCAPSLDVSVTFAITIVHLPRANEAATNDDKYVKTNADQRYAPKVFFLNKPW